MKKYVANNGIIYCMHHSKWRIYLRRMLCYQLSLTRKTPLAKPELKFEDIKVVAHDIFDTSRLNQDDCLEVLRNELSKLEKEQGEEK